MPVWYAWLRSHELTLTYDVIAINSTVHIKDLQAHRALQHV